jgi:hypothetical protein
MSFIVIFALNICGTKSYGQIYLLSGKQEDVYRVEMLYEIKTAFKQLVALLDIFEPINFSNGLNSQQIILTESHHKGDSFQETKLTGKDNILRRLVVQLNYGGLFLSFNYKVTSQLNLEYFHDTNTYPMITQNLEAQEYLKGITLPNDIKTTLRSKLNEVKTQNDAVIIVLNILKNNYHLAMDSKKSAFNKELGQRRLVSFSEYLDVFVSLLRFAQLPARVVHANSLLSSYVLERDKQKLLLFYPRGEYHYAEIHVEGLGWLPIDPFANTLYFVPTNIIRKAVSKRYKDDLERIFVYPKKPVDLVFNKSIFAEKMNPEISFKTEERIPGDDFLFMPATGTREKLLKELLPLSRFMPEELGLYDNPLKIDMEITEELPVTQTIRIINPKTVSSITLPLFFLYVIRDAKLQLEVKSGGKTYQSIPVNAFVSKVDLNYRLVTFNFKKSITLQDQAELTLKIKNMPAIFWYAILGNPMGDHLDTRRKDGYVIHADLCYKLD